MFGCRSVCVGGGSTTRTAKRFWSSATFCVVSVGGLNLPTFFSPPFVLRVVVAVVVVVCPITRGFPHFTTTQLHRNSSTTKKHAAPSIWWSAQTSIFNSTVIAGLQRMTVLDVTRKGFVNDQNGQSVCIVCLSVYVVFWVCSDRVEIVSFFWLTP